METKRGGNASSSNTNEMQGLANKCTGGDMTQLVNSMNDFFVSVSADLTRFNKIATQGAPQMAVDKEANSLSRVYSYYSKFNLRLFYV